MEGADYLKEGSDEIVEEPTFLSGSEGNYPTTFGALDQTQVPNGRKSIKSAVMKGGKKFKAAMVKGGKKFAKALVKGGKKFGPSCAGGCASGGIQAIVSLETD